MRLADRHPGDGRSELNVRYRQTVHGAIAAWSRRMHRRIARRVGEGRLPRCRRAVRKGPRRTSDRGSNATTSSTPWNLLGIGCPSTGTGARYGWDHAAASPTTAPCATRRALGRSTGPRPRRRRLDAPVLAVAAVGPPPALDPPPADHVADLVARPRHRTPRAYRRRVRPGSARRTASSPRSCLVDRPPLNRTYVREGRRRYSPSPTSVKTAAPGHARRRSNVRACGSRGDAIALRERWGDRPSSRRGRRPVVHDEPDLTMLHVPAGVACMGWTIRDRLRIPHRTGIWSSAARRDEHAVVRVPRHAVRRDPAAERRRTSARTTSTSSRRCPRRPGSTRWSSARRPGPARPFVVVLEGRGRARGGGRDTGCSPRRTRRRSTTGASAPSSTCCCASRRSTRTGTAGAPTLPGPSRPCLPTGTSSRPRQRDTAPAGRTLRTSRLGKGARMSDSGGAHRPLRLPPPRRRGGPQGRHPAEGLGDILSTAFELYKTNAAKLIAHRRDRGGPAVVRQRGVQTARAAGTKPTR